MSSIIIIGSTGKMAMVLQNICQEQKLSYKLFSPKAPPSLRVEDFKNSAGVIDFSLPNATSRVLQLAVEAKVPYICGTTGFKSADIDSLFKENAKTITIVKDSNFSLGVELLCEVAEILSAAVSTEFQITDIHHFHKRDAPSGTALKIRDRMLASNSKTQIKIESIREGEVFGEHRLLATFQDQTLEFIHRANSRKPFAEGALQALHWAQKQKPGLYSMKDVAPGVPGK